jgi:hypothetical protein
MVGVPAPADVDLLIRLLSDFGDLGVVGNCTEETIHIDPSPALGEGNVLLGGQFLVAKKDDTVFSMGLSKLFKSRIREIGYVYVVNYGSERTRRGLYAKFGHLNSPGLAAATSMPWIDPEHEIEGLAKILRMGRILNPLQPMKGLQCFFSKGSILCNPAL